MLKTVDKSDYRKDERTERLKTIWKEFIAEFPTEESCLRELCRRILTEAGTTCARCNGSKLCLLDGGRCARCLDCRAVFSLTAGTFFNRIRSARPWLAAIYLLERGVTISSNSLHELVKIAQSSALNVTRKVARAISTNMGSDHPTTKSGSFLQLFCKRSRETPARNHPAFEQKVLDFTDADSDSTDNHIPSSSCESHTTTESAPRQPDVDDETLTAKDQRVFDCISNNKKSFDEIARETSFSPAELSAILTILEVNGLIIRRPGNCYSRKGREDFINRRQPEITSKALRLIVSNSILWVAEIFHGISRKYLQNYLALRWCEKDRDRWKPGTLVSACMKFGPLKYSEVIEYVTPPLVILPEQAKI